jgi:hypothetical protein
MYNKDSAIAYLELKFPHLAWEMHDDLIGGLFHPQMGVFARWANSVIVSGDQDSWGEITRAFLILWRDCDSNVENALNVSFLENLQFVGGRQGWPVWAYDAMPPEMQEAWVAMDDYLRKIHGG